MNFIDIYVTATLERVQCMMQKMLVTQTQKVKKDAK
jgi:hypothetical protein